MRIAGIIRESITDGPGYRHVIFVQGCPHHCPECHNPQSWDFEGGTETTPAELLEGIRKNPMARGVTLSGGEPMCQAEALLEVAQGVKALGRELCIFTGYTFEQLIAQPDSPQYRLLAMADILVDGPFIRAQRNLSLKFRGSSNQRILDVPKSLAQGEAVWTADERWV